MTFRTVDELLERQMAGRPRPAAGERRLVCFARGVAVVEMPPGGERSAGVLTALAEAAMAAASTTTVADGRDESPALADLRARFHAAGPVPGTAPVRAEAVVTRVDPGHVMVEAEVHCQGARIATFEAVYVSVPQAVRAAPPATDDVHAAVA